MSTPVLPQNDQPAAVTRPRKWLPVTAAAGIAAIAAVSAIALTGGNDTKPITKKSLALPAGGAAMAMCLPFSVDILKDFQVAFGGTATEVTASKVVITVDHWYRGGTETQVEFALAPGNSAALDGTDFVQGKRYLVTASEGTVSSCGYSGEASPSFEKSFQDAFGG